MDDFLEAKEGAGCETEDNRVKLYLIISFDALREGRG